MGNFLYVSVVLSSVFVAGCSSFSGLFESAPVRAREIEIQVDPAANNNTATAIDLVILYDKGLLKEFLSLSSKDYFEKYNQLSRDYPGVEVVRWEVVPGKKIPAEPLKYSRGTPKAAVVFADYTTPGQHRYSVGEGEKISVRLMENDFKVTVK